MSFFLERLRLAHLSREMTDTIPLDTNKLLQTSYQQIIAMDEKLQDYVNTLPSFFKLDAESRSRMRWIEMSYPNLPESRYCTMVEVHSRRCKLHQRFLHRQSLDPRYAYSRQACLQSARIVVWAFKDLQDHDSLSTAPELMGIAVHFTHLALVVMIMDLCFNRNQADGAEIKAEVSAALQMFDNAQTPSPLLDRFLNSLLEVLRKHDVQLNDATAVRTREAASSGSRTTSVGNENFGEAEPKQLEWFEQDAQDLSALDETSFEEFWNIAMASEPSYDALRWDNMFSTLDALPL